jgi:hypothetical protein
VECFRPYYLKLGLCDQCTASNYYQNDNGECSDCLDDNCDKCRTSDGKCIKCLAGYAVRKSDLTCTSISDCVAAPVRSEKTHHHNEIINADWCVDTYFCDCSCFEEEGKKCEQCDIGFRVTGLGTCSSCPGACETCDFLTDNTMYCSRCQTGYLVDVVTGNCILTADCKDGRFSSGIYCKKCSNNCLECFTESNCETCRDPYYLWEKSPGIRICGLCTATGRRSREEEEE